MIGRDVVPEQGQHAGAVDVFDGIRVEGHAVEIRRSAHIGRIILPAELTAFAALGRRGIGVIVGNPPYKTNASYSLEDVDEVRQFLDQLVNLMRDE